MEEHLQNTKKILNELSVVEKRNYMDKFLSFLEPNDLIYLNSKLDEYKKDFISCMPIEIIELILGNLDLQTLLNCCQVNKSWNDKISNSLNRIWFNLCLKLLPLDSTKEEDHKTYNQDSNYKQILLKILRESNKLEKGELFKSRCISPIELSALASYKNIVATGNKNHNEIMTKIKNTPINSKNSIDNVFTHTHTASATHIAQFWKLDEDEKENSNINVCWKRFKLIELQSRASMLKFDDTFLVVSTYFMTIDLYDLEKNELLYQYYGHTCSINCFDFNTNLSLIVSGSADNTIKYWSIPTNRKNDTAAYADNCLLIKSEANLIWPVRIQITNYDDNQIEFLVLVLCANGFIYMCYLEKVDEFINISNDNKDNDEFDIFNFKFNLIISDTFKCLLSIYNNETIVNDLDNVLLNLIDDQQQNQNVILNNKSYFTYDIDKKCLSAFLVTDKNAFRMKKIAIKKWLIRKNLDESMFEVCKLDEFDESYFQFLNQRSFKSLNINQLEVISFGYSYCIMMDDDHKFYISNLKKKTIKCIQENLKFDNKEVKVFGAIGSWSNLEQFIFEDKNWLNGFDLHLNTELTSFNTRKLAFCFYTQYRNQVYIIEWVNKNK